MNRIGHHNISSWWRPTLELFRYLIFIECLFWMVSRVHSKIGHFKEGVPKYNHTRHAYDPTNPLSAWTVDQQKGNLVALLSIKSVVKKTWLWMFVLFISQNLNILKILVQPHVIHPISFLSTPFIIFSASNSIDIIILKISLLHDFMNSQECCNQGQLSSIKMFFM